MGVFRGSEGKRTLDVLVRLARLLQLAALVPKVLVVEGVFGTDSLLWVEGQHPLEKVEHKYLMVGAWV